MSDPEPQAVPGLRCPHCGSEVQEVKVVRGVKVYLPVYECLQCKQILSPPAAPTSSSSVRAEPS